MIRYCETSQVLRGRFIDSNAVLKQPAFSDPVTVDRSYNGDFIERA